jgi:hypothetical protein
LQEWFNVHKFKNLDLNLFIVDEISHTSFSDRVNSSDKRSCTHFAPWTKRIFFVSTLFNKFTYSFFTQ